MRYANIDNTDNNKLLGWYNSSIHSVIPTPNIAVTEEQWRTAIANNYNKINSDGSGEVYDFSTAEEILDAKLNTLYEKFCEDRDAITWVEQEDGTVYGYDRKSEDITNFTVARERAKLGGDVYYKVYVNTEDNKQLILHTLDMFNTCLEQSAQEQIQAYTNYSEAKAILLAEADE